MKNKLSVQDKIIYNDRKPTEDEEKDKVKYKNEAMPGPKMANKAIEDGEVRERIPFGEGNVCVTILPGDKLGELHVNVQFEGRRGEYEFCLEGHNELLLHMGEWLKKFLGELGCDFQITIENDPCRKAQTRAEIALAARVVEGMELRQALREMETHKVPVPQPIHIVSEVKNPIQVKKST